MINHLKADIEKIRSRLANRDIDPNWEQGAEEAIVEKEESIKRLEQEMKERAQEIEPSELITLMYYELDSVKDSTTRQLARIFLADRCSIEVSK